MFEATPQGMVAFADYIAAHSKSIYSLLANIAEEGFQLDTIPFLQRGDRSAVISRKLAQLFHGTPYTAAASLGYEKTRRKDERLLLAALTAPTVLDPWLTVLRDARAVLTGIHSLPFLGETLLQKLKIGDDHCILLTVQDQSIRETYFERGKIHFSRLSPLANTSIGGIAQAFASEALKLQQYLLSQRQIARNQSLRAVIVAHPQAMAAVETSCIGTEALAFTILGTDHCCREIGLKTPPADSHADALFAHLVASTKSAIQFAPESLRHDYRLHQVRNALYGVGAVALAACLLFAGKQLFGTYQLDSEAEAIAAQAESARLRYDDIARTFPPIPTSNETLRQIMNRYAELDSEGTSPERMYRDISAAMAASPAIEIDAIDWKAANADTGSPATNIPAGAAARGPTPSAQLRGTVDLGARATPRQILAAFQAFVTTLEANKTLEVRVTQQPFDIDSGKSLRSGSEILAETTARPFTLEILRRRAP